MNNYDFQDRTAIVTGGGQGIGFSVAKRILEGGGKVAVWDVDQELLNSLIENLGGNAANILAQDVDISDTLAVQVASDTVHSTFGKIDILINNAAIVGPNASTWEYPEGAFEEVVRIGLIGTYYVSRAVVPHMISANYGRIVNISSVAGKEGNPGAPAYSSTKAAVLALTKSLGKELAKYDISVNAVTPAVAKTKMALSQDPDFLQMILSKIPRGRMLELSEAAAMICFLASEENSFTTGAVFDLSGGRATY
jgi:NAD(P)-dependent dehydrogenase (short-subunit alcohol dehydrogenase family)|tara:strand:+ start:176 stop:931 length:756 start_codon:yes stop_codon:yes gene_type:complete